MRTIATILAATLAAALAAGCASRRPSQWNAAAEAASAFAQTPKALGWERGQAVPQSAIVKQHASQGPLKSAAVEPVGGLNGTILYYTEELGVCSVVGIHAFVTPEACRQHGLPAGCMANAEDPASQLFKWEDRVAAKFGGLRGARVSDPFGSDYGGYFWPPDNVTQGYASAAVYVVPDARRLVSSIPGESGVPLHEVRLSFYFDNYDACEAEQEAAIQAEL